jgi:hypothetical protein
MPGYAFMQSNGWFFSSSSKEEPRLRTHCTGVYGLLHTRQ